jgi:hypothetical protein
MLFLRIWFPLSNLVLEAKSLTVTDFQYIALKRALPRYEKVYFGCLFTRNHFFTAGKEEYSNEGWEAGQPRSNGRISSKQIGTK